MNKTKELIVKTALRLFSKNGFESVSMRDIAGELELTAPAIYVHFKSKQDILVEILHRMEAQDTIISMADGMPQDPFEINPESYRNIPFDTLLKFTLNMFRYWTEDEFASQFRHLMTIEQYRDNRFQQLYQQFLGAGVLAYLTDIFKENCRTAIDASLFSEAFFSPFILFLNLYDDAPSKKQKAQYVKSLERQLIKFNGEYGGHAD